MAGIDDGAIREVIVERAVDVRAPAGDVNVSAESDSKWLMAWV